MTASGDGHGAEPHAHAAEPHAHEHGELRYVTEGMEPEVFAARAGVVFAPPAPSDDVRAAVRAFLHALAGELSTAGCRLVGHIKGTLTSAERAGPTDHAGLSFSLTSLHGEPRLESTLGDELGTAAFTLNVIVFGVAGDRLAHLVTHAWAAQVPAVTAWHDD